MLIIPDINGCTIIEDNKCCAFSGSAGAIVQQVFVQETVLGNNSTLIIPLVKEVDVLMGSAMAVALCGELEMHNIKVTKILPASPKQVFGVKTWIG